MRKQLATALFSLSLMGSATSYALTYQLPLPADAVVGQVQKAYAQPGQTMDDIAREYDIGYYEILEANPHVNPQHLLPYQSLVIPTQYVLPNAPRQGIVVNLAELRLYYYVPGTNLVETFPVGIGMQGENTPPGQYEIIQKEKNPIWYVTPAVQAAMAKQAWLLPKAVPAGPNNPLGDYAMRLNITSYLIHGTNVPPTIGRRASAGCLHMFPEDIAYLFPQVPIHTSVTIVNQPFKAGWAGQQLYFQARQPLHEERQNNPRTFSKQVVEATIADMKPAPVINWQVVNTASIAQDGVPVVISSLPS